MHYSDASDYADGRGASGEFGHDHGDSDTGYGVGADGFKGDLYEGGWRDGKPWGSLWRGDLYGGWRDGSCGEPGTGYDRDLRYADDLGFGSGSADSHDYAGGGKLPGSADDHHRGQRFVGHDLLHAGRKHADEWIDSLHGTVQHQQLADD